MNTLILNKSKNIYNIKKKIRSKSLKLLKSSLRRTSLKLELQICLIFLFFFNNF